ncbi:sortase [Eggerthellaceae bacterium 24-137]
MTRRVFSPARSNRRICAGARSARTATALLALTLAVGLLAPTIAQADEAAAANTTPVTQGLCDFFATLEGRVDAHGQQVLVEKELEHARRSEEVSEKLRIEALNSKGDEYSKSIEAASQLLNGTATVEELVGEASSDGNGAEADDGSSATATEETPAASSEKSTDSSSSKPRKNMIRFNGEYVSYVQGSPSDETAPATTAAAWVSDGDVTDNENTYFIGHNPGVFSGVMDLELGDKITVWDGKGRSRTYYVFDVLTLPNQSNYFRYEGRIAPTGESITLQTCCADNKHVRCVMAR